MRAGKWIAWTVLGTMTIGVLAGCGGNPGLNGRMQTIPNTEPLYENRGIDIDGDGDRAWLSGHNNINNPPVNLTNLAPLGGGYRDMTQPYSAGMTADRVADLAQSVQGVDTASVVMVGQNAIVGLRLHRTVPRERAVAIAQEVRQLLMVQAPVLRSVRITTDQSLERRVFDLSQSVRNGRALSTTDRDFQDLSRDIPEVPPR
ncbi:YhcN/YlaJ family sporulation lipoprotein [Effusibacillus consociatus]|uniref:YhcN/YlaJ family sporulation lipoprotein n=1 Tax=Effusibacillus consociatus TaxID=1117041 RepID=A0ABV9Q5G0_9BACL